MKYSWDAIRSNIARIIGEAAGFDVTSDDLIAPPAPDFGDIAYGCFAAAKSAKKNPADFAKTLAGKIKSGANGIASATAAGPYLNITLDAADVTGRVVQDVENLKAAYGKTDSGKKKQLMLEYAQPNTHKEIHVGHLRNFALGASLARILQANGWDVVTASYHGDIGAHVAKCLWQLVREHASAVPQSKTKKAAAMDPDAWKRRVLSHFDEAMAKRVLASIPKEVRTGQYLGSVYAAAVKALDETPDLKDQVSSVQRALETKSPGWLKLWQETRRWSVAEMGRIFDELGVALDRLYFESEVQEEGQRIVDELVEKGIAKESEGAVVVDLDRDPSTLGTGLGVFLIRKSDGTTLYATKDLALAKLKFKEYPKLERSLMVVDNRQSLYFRQLFATLRLMGFDKPMEHIGYEFVTLKGGSMSSRSGNVVTWQTFRDEVLKYATVETQKRHPDWNEGRVTLTAWRLMMGGVKFGMLKQDSDKLIAFDLEKALAFEGATGPYIQYAATRLGSILKKAAWKPEKGMKAGDLAALEHPSEKRLAIAIAEFPRAVERAADELRPSVVAQWCLDAAARANAFYRDVPVLEAPLGVKQARLRLAAAAQSVLLLGLNFLGIPVPDEM